MTFQSAKSAAGDSSDLVTTQAGETSHDVVSKVDDTYQEQSAPKVFLLLISVLLSMFIVGLDRTIISTAIPHITDEFNSLPDVGWYGSAYLLTCCAFQLLFGKLYTLYAVKGVFLSSVLLFEIGSVICGAAPSSAAFIIGRAFAGIGAAGIFAGSIVSIVYVVPLEKACKIQGLFGAIFGLSSIVGPLIGVEQWAYHSIVDSRGALLLVFVAVQILLPKTSMVPPRIFKQRSVLAGSWATICIGASSYIIIYYLPVWFQSINGVSAVESGIRILPFMLSMVIASIFCGLTTQKIGYYTPLAIAGSCIMSLGAGLLTTLQLDTGEGKWIGYQVLYGFGMGLCFQAPSLAVQTVLPQNDAPIGLALIFFCQLIGAAVFVSIAENVLDNQLLQRLSGLPGFNPNLITSNGATSLLTSVPADLRLTVLEDYNEALRTVFQIALVLSCLAALGSAALEWRSILKKPETSVEAATERKLAADDV